MFNGTMFLSSMVKKDLCGVMEVFSKEFSIGNLKIELSVEQTHGCRVIFTARDKDDRRVWRTPLMDVNGEAKVYESCEDAVLDGQRKLQTALSID
jgi:hypothetical protein